ncbi:hypothetical protein NIBR502774_12500 [Rhizobium sp. NIBRBAC000502774]|nr:hypothetical protein NIBR502774_12500 [Rhizobium sp. NIBRBAC000502774]
MSSPPKPNLHIFERHWGLLPNSMQTSAVALGERGPVWWNDGEPDLNRTLVRNSLYSEWYADLPK